MFIHNILLPKEYHGASLAFSVFVPISVIFSQTGNIAAFLNFLINCLSDFYVF